MGKTNSSCGHPGEVTGHVEHARQSDLVPPNEQAQANNASAALDKAAQRLMRERGGGYLAAGEPTSSDISSPARANGRVRLS
jgi:hypothetical protein